MIAEFSGDVSGVCIFMDTRCTTNIWGVSGRKYSGSSKENEPIRAYTIQSITDIRKIQERERKRPEVGCSHLVWRIIVIRWLNLFDELLACRNTRYIVGIWNGYCRRHMAKMFGPYVRLWIACEILHWLPVQFLSFSVRRFLYELCSWLWIYENHMCFCGIAV